MKRLTILTCLLVLGFSTFASNTPRGNVNHNCIHVVSMDGEIFYFRSDKEMAGATIDVYDYATGEKVMSDSIKSKKTVVDLYEQKPGDYIILITKGEFKRKYVYHRR